MLTAAPPPPLNCRSTAGDSITVAPAQTLTDKEYQRLRDASIAIIREMGVECGGSNVQVRGAQGCCRRCRRCWG